LPDENVNKKPNSPKKRPEKGQTDCLKTRKMPNFICGIFIPLSQRKILNCKNNKKSLQSYGMMNSCLALYGKLEEVRIQGGDWVDPP